VGFAGEKSGGEKRAVRISRKSIVSKIRGGVSLTGPGLSRKMWGRKIRPRRLSAIFLPGIFLLPPIFERILEKNLRKNPNPMIDTDPLSCRSKRKGVWASAVNDAA
jgi:hypothetical protein